MLNHLLNPMLFCKEKHRDEVTREILIYDYMFSFIEKMCNLYTFESFDVETTSHFIQRYAILNGHCGLAKFDDGKYYVGVGNYCGELDADGYGKEYQITLQNGKTFRGTIGKDVVVLKHDNIGLSKFPSIYWYAQMLADTDVSLKASVIYSRLLPIPIVDDTLESKSIEEVIKNIFKGKMSVIKRVSKREFFHEGEAQTHKDTLDLCNPQASAFIQNLSRFHDELILRQCLEMGVYVSARDKGAQLNEKELSAFEDYCTISSDDTFEQYKKFCKDTKEVFDIDITVTPKNFTFTNDDIVNKEETIEDVNNEESFDVETENEEREKDNAD